MENRDATKTNVGTMKKAQKIQRLMLDSGAPDPVNGRIHLKTIKMVHPSWIKF